jgi:hypothetical protein
MVYVNTLMLQQVLAQPHWTVVTHYEIRRSGGVNPSRNVRPEHPKGEAGRKHV